MDWNFRRNVRSAMLGVSAATLVSGCAAQAKAPPPPETKTQTRLIFSANPGADPGWGNQFLWSGLERFRKDDEDKRLVEQCIAPAKAPTSGFLAFLVGPLVSLFTSAVKSSLDDELKRYGAEFKAAEQTGYWKTDVAGAVPEWRCFRVTRLRTVTEYKPDGKPLRATRTVDFDFLGQVATMGAGDREAGSGTLAATAYGTKVRPLRVYLGKPLAKGSRIGMSASLSFEAIWREENIGKRETIFTVPILEHKFKGSGPIEARSWGEPHYFPAKLEDGSENKDSFPNWAQAPLLPLVPWSKPAGPAGTAVTVTFAAAEVGDGDGKVVVKALAKLFGTVKEDVDSLLTKAGKKLVDPEAPAPVAKPDLFCGTFTPQGDGSVAGQWTKVDGSCPTS